jgi:hypothetical protein
MGKIPRMYRDYSLGYDRRLADTSSSSNSVNSFTIREGMKVSATAKATGVDAHITASTFAPSHSNADDGQIVPGGRDVRAEADRHQGGTPSPALARRVSSSPSALHCRPPVRGQSSSATE